MGLRGLSECLHKNRRKKEAKDVQLEPLKKKRTATFSNWGQQLQSESQFWPLQRKLHAFLVAGLLDQMPWMQNLTATIWACAENSLISPPPTVIITITTKWSFFFQRDHSKETVAYRSIACNGSQMKPQTLLCLCQWALSSISALFHQL